MMHSLLLVGLCTAGKLASNQMIKPQTYATLALPEKSYTAVQCLPTLLLSCCISLTAYPSSKDFISTARKHSAARPGGFALQRPINSDLMQPLLLCTARSA